jgi:hypothetical protein
MVGDLLQELILSAVLKLGKIKKGDNSASQFTQGTQ